MTCHFHADFVLQFRFLMLHSNLRTNMWIFGSLRRMVRCVLVSKCVPLLVHTYMQALLYLKLFCSVWLLLLFLLLLLYCYWCPIQFWSGKIISVSFCAFNECKPIQFNQWDLPLLIFAAFLLLCHCHLYFLF